ILLSATVPNTLEFASWVGRTKKKDIYVISTLKRPVPLEYFLWVNKSLVKIVDSNMNFLTQGYKEATLLIKKPKVTKPSNDARGRGQKHQSTNHLGRANIRSQTDKYVFVHLVDYLKKQNLLPVVVFVFSKKRCEEYASTLSNIDLSIHSEKSEIHIAIEKAVARLRVEDRLLPQIARMRDFLGRGIAVHHGGLLPIVKEIVELLFARGLVKILFATETFAMGVNMPAKSVVFSSMRKHDGQSLRDLLPGEMTQMAGRAGRRGLDVTGTVIILSGPDELPSSTMLSSIILGKPSKLESQFRLTYNMILNLLRVETLKIEEMIKRSFSENATQSLFPEQQQLITHSENSLASLSVPECDICKQDLSDCYSLIIKAAKLRCARHTKAITLPLGHRILAPGRFCTIREDACPRRYTWQCYLAISGIWAKSFQRARVYVGSLPYLGPLCNFFPQFSLLDKPNPCLFSIDQVESITDCALKIKSPEILSGNVESLQKLQDSFQDLWQHNPAFVKSETSWLKSKDVELQELVAKYEGALVGIEKSHCIKCPKFSSHFAALHQIETVRLQIHDLRQTMSDQNLELMPDYQQRLAVLRDLEFINEDANINSANSLVITELVLENLLVSFEPEEIAALLSAFVFDEKSEIEQSISAHLESGKEQILRIAEHVQDIELKRQVSSLNEANILGNIPRFSLMEIVYEWARGMAYSFSNAIADECRVSNKSRSSAINRKYMVFHLREV
ncbi:putative ATP-dependent RNA helicase, partial [Neolecta irregularis DAH-3]